MHVQKTNSAHKRGSRLIGPIQQVPVDCEQAQPAVPHEFLMETKNCFVRFRCRPFVFIIIYSCCCCYD